MINLTPNATTAIRRFIRCSESPVAGLRILIEGGGCSGFQYGLRLEGEPQEDDTALDIDGVRLLVDPMSYSMLAGVTVDFVETLTHTGFRFDNPNASTTCGCGHSFTV